MALSQQAQKQAQMAALRAPMVIQARAAIDTDRLPEAVTLLHSLLQSDPGGLGTILVQASLAMAIGEQAAALDAFTYLTERLSPSLLEYRLAWTQRCRLLQSLGQFEAAEQAALTSLSAARAVDQAKDNLCGITYNELARLALRRQDYTLALESARAASEILPMVGDVWNHLGLALVHQAQTDAAVVAFRRCLERTPKSVAALMNLGSVLSEGDLAAQREAEQIFRQALQLDSRAFNGWYFLLRLLKRQHRLPEAIACAEQALPLLPAGSASHLRIVNAYANCLREEGRQDAARQILGSLEPFLFCNDPIPSFSVEEKVDIIVNLSLSMIFLEDFENSKRSLLYAQSLSPHNIGLLNAFSQWYYLQSDFSNALGYLDQLLEKTPEDGVAMGNKALILRQLGLLQDAQSVCCSAMERGIYDIEILNTYSIILTEQRRFKEGLQMIIASLKADPLGGDWLWSNFCYGLTCDEDCCLDEWRDVHQRYAQYFSSGLPDLAHPHRNDRSLERKLRVGYVSPDFRTHSVSYFLEPLLRQHDSSVVEVTLYAVGSRRDETTERLKGYAHRFVDLSKQTYSQMAEVVANDQIDVLVDLAGHTSDNALPMFALRPAPVQVTWLGYPGSTGLKDIDARIVDEITDPIDSEKSGKDWASERLIRLSRCFLAYDQPENVPKVSPQPCLQRKDGIFTFGSFNTAHKIGSKVVSAWSEILRHVPNSRLFLKARQFMDESVQADLWAEFAAHGIAAERVEMVHHAKSYAEHLAMYSRIDLALDTFPYNGTTTTCEALWMGVPTLTFAGDRHMARVGASLLTSVGLQDTFLTDSIQRYIERAIFLSQHPVMLAEHRRQLRHRMAQSPLCDAADMARTLETVYRQLWQDWCRRSLTSYRAQPIHHQTQASSRLESFALNTAALKAAPKVGM